MSNWQAVILAGGKGSRLRPYTTILPKPLIPIGEFPIAEIIIRQLKFYGITDIVISTGHLAELIEAYFADGKRWGVSIRYVREDEPLGTAGALKAIPKLKDNFLVINGDTLTDLNFRSLFDFHKKRKGLATIAVKKCVTQNDFGVITFNKNLLMTDYVEKPKAESFLSLGINVLNKQCTEFVRSKEILGMPELMLRIKQNNQSVYCFEMNDMWFDLGRMVDLQAAQDVFEKNKTQFFKE